MDCKLGNSTVNVLHLGLIIVHPDVRQGGFSWILYGLTTTLVFLRNRLYPIWITNVTQVPAIIGKVTESFGEVHPNPIKPARHKYKQLVLAREIMTHHRHVFGVGKEANFNEEKFVIENSYTGGSDHLKKKFEEASPHRNEIYNKFCKENLDYNRGDDFLQIGVINTEMMFSFLIKDIPKKSFLRIILLFIFIFIQGLILPLLIWFQSDKQSGMIRPWRA
jgi:hypothetical protein